MFAIHESKHDGQSTLKLAGDLTIYSAAEAQKSLEKHLHKKSFHELDLSAVEEIDTAGVQVLLWAKREAQGAGHPLALVNHSQGVIDVFELLKVTGIFGDPILIAPPSH